MTRALHALALAIFCAAWPSPTVAKCTRDCRQVIAAEGKVCRGVCLRGTAGKVCRRTCKYRAKFAAVACKVAASPTPPACRETTTTSATTTTAPENTTSTTGIPGCIDIGAPCGPGTFCCDAGNADCVNGTCCLLADAPCDPSASACCPGTACTDGRCQVPCLENHAPCSGALCCSGLDCRNGTCCSTTTCLVDPDCCPGTHCYHAIVVPLAAPPHLGSCS